MDQARRAALVVDAAAVAIVVDLENFMFWCRYVMLFTYVDRPEPVWLLHTGQSGLRLLTKAILLFFLNLTYLSTGFFFFSASTFYELNSLFLIKCVCLFCFVSSVNNPSRACGRPPLGWSARALAAPTGHLAAATPRSRPTSPQSGYVNRAAGCRRYCCCGCSSLP